MTPQSSTTAAPSAVMSLSPSWRGATTNQQKVVIEQVDQKRLAIGVAHLPDGLGDGRGLIPGNPGVTGELHERP